MKKIRLLIVDDSALYRRVLTSHFEKDARFEVVGAAQDAYEARDFIVELKPDVITLDLVMPKMDGIEFLGVLQKHWPLPVIVVSGRLTEDPQLSRKALAAGASAVFSKSGTSDTSSLDKLSDLVVSVVQGKPLPKIKLGSASLLEPKPSLVNSNKIVVIGASTGGTEAIKEVLVRIPPGCPGIVMVQHMPAGFTASFAERLNMLSPNLSVKEAKDGDEVKPGTALLAPGDFQMSLVKKPGGYSVQVKEGEAVNRHKPSVDVIFNSAASVAGSHAIGVILTGMGADGAKGLLKMKQSGARTIAQDEASCVVFGMPREAIALGAADQVVPLLKVADAITKLLG